MNKKILGISYLLIIAAFSQAQPTRASSSLATKPYQALVPHVPKDVRQNNYQRALDSSAMVDFSLESSLRNADNNSRNENSINAEWGLGSVDSSYAASVVDPSLRFSGQDSYVIDGEDISPRVDEDLETRIERVHNSLKKDVLRERILTGSLNALKSKISEKQQQLFALLDDISELEQAASDRTVPMDAYSHKINQLYDLYFELLRK